MDEQERNNQPESTPAKKKGNRFLFWGLILIFAVIFLVSAYFVGSYWLESRGSKQLQQEIIDMRPTSDLPSIPTGTTQTGSAGTTGTTGTTGATGTTTTSPVGSTTQPPPSTDPPEPEILEDLKAIYERNNHLVGWIYIPGTENAYQNFAGINYPVVQTPNKPEWHNYYLYRNFDGEDDDHGWIYIREACDVFAPCDNIVIYGHNMADGTMFGQVVNYRHQSYYEEHKYIYFDTLYERHAYEIIAVFHTSGTTGVGYAYHSRNNFKDEADFNEFINAIKGGDSRVRVFYNIETSAQYGDKLITLSTCWKTADEPDGRLVVVAKLIV